MKLILDSAFVFAVFALVSWLMTLKYLSGALLAVALVLLGFAFLLH